MMMRILTGFLVLLVLGCSGYSAPGEADRWVGGEARTVYVQLFENMTSEPYLDYYVTDALVSELAGSNLVTLTEDQNGADVHMIGLVEDFSTRAVAHGSTDRIAEYSAEVTVSVQLEERATGTIIWKTRVSKSEDFVASVDKNMQLANQRQAAQKAAKRIAEDIHSHLSNTF